MRIDLNLALLQPVADEQVLDDGDHLLPAQPIEPVPPAFEVQESLLLGVDVRKEVGILVPDGRLGLEALEVLREPGSVEATQPKVCKVVRQPHAAHEPGGDAHGIEAGLFRPIGERRTVQYHRSGEALAVRGHERCRPTGLAVAIQDGRLSEVQPRHVLDKLAKRRQHVRQGLAGAWFREEDDEVDRVAHVKGDADLGVALEAADAGTMARARVDDDDRRLCRIDAVVPALVSHLRDAQQCVVGRPLELARVEEHLRPEVQQCWKFQTLMLEHGVGALPQRIEEQDRALQHVPLIREDIKGRSCGADM